MRSQVVSERTGGVTIPRFGASWEAEMRRLATLFAVTVLALQGLVAPAEAIIEGQPDGNRHPYVGMAFNDQFLCSGSLIAPTVFLTAGHCTDLLNDPALGQTWVTFQ